MNSRDRQWPQWGTSRHPMLDPSNNLNGSTAAVRRRFGKGLLLALTGCVGLSVSTSVVGGQPAVPAAVRDLLSLSSRPEEFHLRALPEPCMTLSSHTAPDVLEQLPLDLLEGGHHVLPD
jgi:hypothetical protein